MGWFSKNEAPVQTFGAPSGMMMNANPYGNSMGAMGAMGGMGGMSGMYGMQDPAMGMGGFQNPMMQHMANDPVLATSKLLQYHDPVATFIASQNMGVLTDLFGELFLFALKDFFSNVKFATSEDGEISMDLASLPTAYASMSPENMMLTLQRLQTACNGTIQSNYSNTQMLLQAHNPFMQQQQPGFFGSMLGSLLGQQAQSGGMGRAMSAGAAMI
jgi:hypothetical protein